VFIVNLAAGISERQEKEKKEEKGGGD